MRKYPQEKCQSEIKMNTEFDKCLIVPSNLTVTEKHLYVSVI